LLDSVFGFFSGRVAGGGQFAGSAAPEMEVVDDVGEVAFGIEAAAASADGISGQALSPYSCYVPSVPSANDTYNK